VKIYTKGGDQGETHLLDGSRVPKDDARVAAYGAVDELNALLGVVRAALGEKDPARRLLDTVQRDLFAAGAQLADPRARIGEKREKASFAMDRVLALEKEIDLREARLPPLRNFILPGGSNAGALLHVARTVCRRAEREAVALQRSIAIDPPLLAYLNRLSDLLFVLARDVNEQAGKPEESW
jgi:cob(I)alamin adenosyltransferase